MEKDLRLQALHSASKQCPSSTLYLLEVTCSMAFK